MVPEGSFNPENDVVGHRLVSTVDDFDHVIARLPQLATVFLRRRDLMEKEGIVRIEYLIVNPIPPRSDTNIKRLPITGPQNLPCRTAGREGGGDFRSGRPSSEANLHGVGRWLRAT